MKALIVSVVLVGLSALSVSADTGFLIVPSPSQAILPVSDLVTRLTELITDTPVRGVA